MNLFTIAVRNLTYRKLPTALTMLSMALGVALVVLVLTISGVIHRTFDRTNNVGYNLIIGAKGSDIQLTFNTVFFLSQPVENIQYSYYMEYMADDGRQKEYERIGGVLKDPERNGLYSFLIKGGFAIPLCMGDYIGTFRCIGTTPDYFDLLKHGNGLDYKFAKGRNFVDYSNENGYFEAVVGAQVAAEMKLDLGSEIFASHGAAGGAKHDQEFVIVGILEPTGTPNDRGAFVNIEGFYLLEGHVAPNRDEAGREEKGSATAPERDSKLSKVRLPIEKREVTAILVKTDEMKGMNGIGLQRQVNKSKFAQAVSPIGVISGLLNYFIRPIKWALLAITSLVCIVSAISILVGIYNSMNERKRDIAVMRALGASRDHITAIILVESVLIAVGGGFIGWILGHAIGPLTNAWTEQATGMRIEFLSVNSIEELFIVPGLILIGILAGIIPALAAYRTSVAKSL